MRPPSNFLNQINIIFEKIRILLLVNSPNENYDGYREKQSFQNKKIQFNTNVVMLRNPIL